jgi:hypothetical protein
MKDLKIIIALAFLPLFLSLSACGDSDSTHDAVWSDGAQLAGDVVSRHPQLGADGNGNIIAVWAQSNGFYVNRFNKNTGWGTPRQLGNAGFMWSDLKLAVSRNGHAVVAWVQLDDIMAQNVHVIRYVPDAGWGPEENLDEIRALSDLAVDDTGNAIIAADQDVIGEPIRGITIARSNQASGWSYERIEYLDISTGASYPRVSVDGSGNGFIMWVEGYNDDYKEYVSSLSPAGIGEPQQIASLPGSSAAWTNVAVDDSGNAMALWGQFDPSFVSRTYACRYTPADGWGAAERIDDSPYDTIDQFLSVDPLGNFNAVWTQRTENVTSDIYSRRYTPSGGWQIPLRVGIGGIARSPRIAADAIGNLFATWMQYDLVGPFTADANVYVNHSIAGSRWGTQQQLKNALGGADEPLLAVYQPGRAMVMWPQSTGSVGGLVEHGIFFSRFD